MSNTFDRDILKVPVNVVLWASPDRADCLQDLAMWLIFKRVYGSGHFHSTKVPPQLHITRPTFNKYLNSFIDRGWATKIGLGFQMISLDKLSTLIRTITREATQKYNFQRFIKIDSGTKSEVVSELRWILLHHSHQQIRYATVCRKMGIHYLEQRKLPKTLAKEVMAQMSYTHSAPMSVSKIADSIGMSKTTGQRVKYILKDMDMLHSKSQKVEVLKRNVSHYEWVQFKRTMDCEDCYFWRNDSFKNGLIIKFLPDLVTLTNTTSTYTKTSSSFTSPNNTVPISFTDISEDTIRKYMHMQTQR